MFQVKGKWQMQRESALICVSLLVEPTGLSIPVLMNAQQEELEKEEDEGEDMEVAHDSGDLEKNGIWKEGQGFSFQSVYKNRKIRFTLKTKHEEVR